MGTDDLRPAVRKIVKAACPHDCPDTCATEISVENGVAVEVRGGAMPFTGDVLCTKVWSAIIRAVGNAVSDACK